MPKKMCPDCNNYLIRMKRTKRNIIDSVTNTKKRVVVRVLYHCAVCNKDSVHNRLTDSWVNEK